MGFETSCQLKLNHDRRAAGQQRDEQKPQVQIIVHTATHTPEGRRRQLLFSRRPSFSAPYALTCRAV
jgi:hypothetical protein